MLCNLCLKVPRKVGVPFDARFVVKHLPAACTFILINQPLKLVNRTGFAGGSNS